MQVENLLRVTLYDHPTVDHLIQGQHNDLEGYFILEQNRICCYLQVVEQRLLVNIFPEDLRDCIEEAVKDRHQKKLILLTASQLSNINVRLVV